MKVRWWMFGVVAAGVAWFGFASERAPALPDAPPPAATSTSGTGPVAGATADDGARRETAPATPADTPPLATTAEPTAPFDPAPPAVTPWLARLLVADEDERPIADAEITIWPAQRVPADARFAKLSGVKGNSYSGRAERPLLQLHTDATGRAQATLALEACFAAAAKSGLGRSAEVLLWHTRADKEIQLVIEQPIVLRGVVLRADGAPAAGAQVVATINGFSSAQHGTATEPQPATTDSAGRFAIDVSLHAGYRMEAQLDGAKTLSEMVWIHRREPPAVTLRFPGGITINGLVLDTEGNPVAGAQVTGWREYHLNDPKQDLSDYERLDGKTGADGRFSIAVRKLARYQVVASKQGHANSAPTWAETNEVRPHAEVRLVLSKMTNIAGRVVHGDGAPFAGVRVAAYAEHFENVIHSPVVPSGTELFGEVASVMTDGDGRFVLAVAPTTPWDVFALPASDNWRLRTWQRGVAAGRDDIEFRITDEELAGCVVHGIVERTDGEPLPEYRVDIVDYEAGRVISSSTSKATIDGARFSLPPLPRGEQFGVRVTAGGRGYLQGPLAPAVVGPFATDQAELNLTFRLQPWGNVSVRVLTADGSPVHRVRVMPHVDQPTGNGWGSLPVDAEGRASFASCPPGQIRFKVFEENSQLCEQEALITPGPNPEITIRLPAAKGR